MRSSACSIAALVLLASASRSIAADSSPADLVRALGSSSFSARERASKRLAELGLPAAAPLRAALADPNAERRRRAQQVLIGIEQQDFELRLEGFGADAGGTHDYKIPGWRQFRAIVGDSRAARELMVDMQRAEPGLLAAVESDPKAAETLFGERSSTLVESLDSEQVFEVSSGSVAALMLASAAQRVTVDEQVAGQVHRFVLQKSFQPLLSAGSTAPLLKKLLGAWMVRNDGPGLRAQNLMIALALDMEESLSVSLDVLRAEQREPRILPYALLGIGKYGNREHLTLIEPHLANASSDYASDGEGQREQPQGQIRDVALAVAVHLTGQSLKDYGFRRAELNDPTLFEPLTLGFKSDAKRTAALAKWTAWRKAHPE